MTNFERIRECYADAREAERIKICEFLKERGFDISARGGKGRNNYTSGGRLTVSYDLSNWKYAETSLGKVNFLISLQSFDVDPNSGNLHVLYDRIGIYAYCGKYDHRDARENMQITGIDLPLNAAKLEELERILRGTAEAMEQ